MRTAKRVNTLLIVALVGVNAATVRSGQDNASGQISNTRAADCLVRITTDPGVLPLNMETLEGVLDSSAVRGKAMTEVLGPGTVEDSHKFIFVDWLSEATSAADARPPRSSGMAKGSDTRNSPRSDMKSGAASGSGTGGMMGGSGGGGVMGGGGMGIGTMGEGTEGMMTMGGLGEGMRGMGMMGGMGGGASGMGMGGFYGAPTGPKGASTVEHSVVVRLTVEFPDEFKPVAREFLSALVVNLRNCLLNTHDKYAESLEELLESARQQRERTLERLKQTGGSLSADAARVKEQLHTIVDLSVLSPQTPFGEAIEVLKNAVAPPLQIVALWRDLFEQANVEPSTPANIDGMPSVRLGTALDLLVKGMSDPLPGAPPVVYRIQDSVIVIGSSTALGMSNASVGSSEDQADIRALAIQRSDRARAIQDLELDLAGMEARQKAIQERIAVAEEQASKQLADDIVTVELRRLVDLTMQNLDSIQKSVNAGRAPMTDLNQAMESMTRAKIDLARRREEVMKSVGGGQLEQYTAELSAIAIDRAEKQAQLDILHKQLDDAQRQLTQASIFDPEAARARTTQEALNIVNRRVGELETRLAALQRPTVLVVGDN
mgnify:CR=1 FL=1